MRIEPLVTGLMAEDFRALSSKACGFGGAEPFIGSQVLKES